MSHVWYKASDGTEWTNKAHRGRYEEERRLAKRSAPFASKLHRLTSWILKNFKRKVF